MDLSAIIRMVNKLPKEKWDDDTSIKNIMREALDQTGRSYTEADLNRYMRQFRRIARSGSPLPLISMLLRHGISKSQIDEIQSKIKKR